MANALLENKTISPGKFGGTARYMIKMDAPQASVEANYFWLIRFLENRAPNGRDYGYIGKILKIKDVFTAAESSAYWGSIEQRRGAQIDKYQQLMANVGQMVKGLFQLLRELRILDERLELYEKSSQGEISAEVALKDVWITMVEGGARNPASVIGLASQVNFVTLPDFFFAINPRTREQIEGEVNKLEDSAINRKVREVLARKLYQYMVWKEKTYHELKVGKQFRLKYLAQHFNVIRLYLNWLRPYLRNIKRLTMGDPTKDKDIIAAFDTSRIELEFLAVKEKYEVEVKPYGKEIKEFQDVFPVIRVKLNFVSIPQLAFQEEYNRGPIHRGRTDIMIEAFTASKQELEEYQSKADEEDLELLKTVDESIDALKEDITHYLKEAGQFKEDEKEKPPESTVFTPFKEIVTGFKELFGISLKPKALFKSLSSDETDTAKSIANLDAYLLYAVFKKAHGMLAE